MSGSPKADMDGRSGGQFQLGVYECDGVDAGIYCQWRPQMPVVNVLDHWIEVYSSNREVTHHADFLFWFGYEAPPDILVTTCLSALTLGVDIERKQVGTIGTRISRYVWLAKNGAIRYRQIPPSFDWNSERISRCVSVEVRTSVFYASGTSLSTVYVLKQPVLVQPRDVVARRLVAYEGSSGKVAHSLDIVGAADQLDRYWSTFQTQVKTDAARFVGSDPGRIRLVELRPTGSMGQAQVNTQTGKLVRLPHILKMRRAEPSGITGPPAWLPATKR